MKKGKVVNFQPPEVESLSYLVFYRRPGQDIQIMGEGTTAHDLIYLRKYIEGLEDRLIGEVLCEFSDE